ncbi:GNAT family N-acetyltransferase [Dyella sp. KRB-257]|uniref:GNAT family N-acetyltransferase n=1 Tax=Dyella sp. KRB-257 TaxID=3400915 RepID=UPI003C0B6EA1
MLSDPERHILAPGGAIFFARLGEQVIGTCALLQESPGVFELTKMGVDETFRGLGAGRRLLDACIAEFHRRKGHTLFLESNSRLTTALRMYEKAGFVMQPGVRPGSHYERADVYMVYQRGA